MSHTVTAARLRAAGQRPLSKLTPAERRDVFADPILSRFEKLIRADGDAWWFFKAGSSGWVANRWDVEATEGKGRR